MVPRTSLLLMTIWALLLPLACASGYLPPVSPAASDCVGLSPRASSRPESPGRYLWGYYLIFVDPASFKFEIIPMRQAEGHWNVLKWLEQGPCMDCFKIKHIEPSGNGTLLCDIEVKHFSPSQNLTGFDVRGIAMFNGTHAFPVSALAASDRNANEGELVNADGYTTLYNATTEGSGPGGLQGYIKGKFGTFTYPTATLNGFKRFVSDDPSNTRNALLAGDAVTVVYEIAMPAGPFVFGYAVDSNWAPPTHKPVTDPMNDFPISANCPEPWKVEVTEFPISGGLTETGGSTKLVIDVWDWQGKTSHAVPKVECPDLLSGELPAAWKEDFADHSRYEVVAENKVPAGAGEYLCLISVEDNENQGSPEWLDLTAYRVVRLKVAEITEQPPIAIATADPFNQTICDPIHFTDDGSYDPDGGNIVKYEWDWDNDGTFDEEGAGVDHSWDTKGTYYVQFRVTDDEGESDVLDTPLEITTYTAAPTAVAKATPGYVGQPTLFDGSDSHDNDCGGKEIVDWYWDLHGCESLLLEGCDPTYVYGGQGIASVDLQVIDDEWQMDATDAPVEFEIVPDPSKNGWVRTWGGHSGGDRDSGYGVAIDSAGNVYVTGFVFGSYDELLDFDPGPGISPGEYHNGTFLSKFAPDGSFIWAILWGRQYSFSWWKPCDITIDSQDNLYVAGLFETSIDLDPGPGEDWRYSGPLAWGTFVSKFDKDGNYIWGRSWGDATSIMDSHSIAADKDDNIFITGSWENKSLDFDPSSGEDIHNGAGCYDAYLTKLDESGNYLWARTWGGDGDNPFNYFGDAGDGVDVDDSGNAYVTGYYCGQNVDFDPGPGVDIHSCNGDYEDAFLIKYAPDGTYQWGLDWGAGDNDMEGDHGYEIAFDGPDNLYVAGNFCNTEDFDPGPGVVERTPNLVDAFVSKFDTNGVFKWVLTWGGPTVDNAYAVAVDESGALCVTGFFSSPADLDPGPSVDDHTSVGTEGAFLCKFSSDGNLLWNGSWGGPGTDTPYPNAGRGLAIDGAGQIFVTGSFDGDCDFDPGPDVDLRTPIPDHRAEVFLSKFPPDGNW